MTNKIRHYLTYLLPWVFILIGIWAFFQITSFRYAKAINFIDWLVSGSDNIELALRDVDTVMGIMKRAIFTRVFWIVWLAGFSISVINLGYYIQNKKQDYAPGCEIVDKVAYKKLRSIIQCYKNYLLKLKKTNILKDLNQTAERLSYESDFGYGSADIIEYENEIYAKICLVGEVLHRLSSSQEVCNDDYELLADTIRNIDILLDERAEAQKIH